MNSQITLNESQDLTLYPARLKIFLGLAGSLAIVAACLWVVVPSGNILNTFMGSIGIIFFGLGALVFLFNFVNPLPVLVANEEGIRQRGLFWSVFVAWEEIAAIIASKGRNATLNIYISESGERTFSARYPRSWRISRLFGEGMPALSVPWLLLPIPAQRVSEILQERYQRQIEEYDILIR